MKQNEPLHKIMTTAPVTVHHGDPVSKVRRIFNTAPIHHLPVVNGEDLVGMITWTDLLRVSFGDAFGQSDEAVDATLDHSHTLEDIMTADPVSIDKNASIRDAVDLLCDADFHALPVVEGKKLVGIVSSQDLLRYLRGLY